MPEADLPGSTAKLPSWVVERLSRMTIAERSKRRHPAITPPRSPSTMSYSPVPGFTAASADLLVVIRPEPLVRGFLVRAHQTRVACHIDGQDRGETAGRGHSSGIPALRRPAK
jgi:hypothetical protein